MRQIDTIISPQHAQANIADTDQTIEQTVGDFAREINIYDVSELTLSILGKPVNTRGEVDNSRLFDYKGVNNTSEQLDTPLSQIETVKRILEDPAAAIEKMIEDSPNTISQQEILELTASIVKSRAEVFNSATYLGLLGAASRLSAKRLAEVKKLGGDNSPQINPDLRLSRNAQPGTLGALNSMESGVMLDAAKMAINRISGAPKLGGSALLASDLGIAT